MPTNTISVDQILRDYARGLKSKTGVDGVGMALAAVGAHFGVSELMITEVDAVMANAENAVVFSARSLPDLRAYLQGRPLATNPLFKRSWQPAAPVLLSELRHEMKLDESEVWELLPPWAKGNEAVSVNVQSAPSRRLNFAFAGKGARVEAAACSVLLVAASMASEHLTDLQHGETNAAKLSNREREVMHLLASGKTDEEVAALLQIASRTVRFHVENAKRKLGVATRAQAVLMVLRGDLP